VICQFVREGDDDSATICMQWSLLWARKVSKKVIANRNLLQPSHLPPLSLKMLEWVPWSSTVPALYVHCDCEV
jgi:hypothetical protein